MRAGITHPDLVELARAHGGRIIVPTGALVGFDAVRAAAEGRIDRVRITTRCMNFEISGRSIRFPE